MSTNDTKAIAIAILLHLTLINVAVSEESLTAFTKNGEEVELHKNGKWNFKKQKQEDTGKVIKAAVRSLDQDGDWCKLKFEFQNTTHLNFKEFWPNAHIVDQKGYRFSTKTIQIGLRPNQNILTDENFKAKCSDVSRVEIDSFTFCTRYDGNDVKEMRGCEEAVAPLLPSKVPLVVLKNR
jgi:hypothetical protein